MTVDVVAPRDPRHRVDRRAIRLWAAESALTGLLIAVVLAVPGIIWPSVRPWVWIAAAAVVLVTAVVTAVMPGLRYRIHRWEATDTAVYVRTGWLSREWKAAPLSRVQAVESTRTPLHRLLGLASVTVTTASSAGAMVIEGLDVDRAASLALELTAVTERTKGDAT